MLLIKNSCRVTYNTSSHNNHTTKTWTWKFNLIFKTWEFFKNTFSYTDFFFFLPNYEGWMKGSGNASVGRTNSWNITAETVDCFRWSTNSILYLQTTKYSVHTISDITVAFTLVSNLVYLQMNKAREIGVSG